LRGRSLAGRFIVVDDAQNLRPQDVKTLITRASVGTKIVFTGDPEQIDVPYLDSLSNGLTHLVQKFRGQNLYGHITLKKPERSRPAELAAQLL